MADSGLFVRRRQHGDRAEPDADAPDQRAHGIRLRSLLDGHGAPGYASEA